MKVSRPTPRRLSGAGRAPLLAAVLALALLAAACTSGEPDVTFVAIPPETTTTQPPPPPTTVPPPPPETTTTSTAAPPPPPSTTTTTAPPPPRPDPADPLPIDPEVRIGALDNGLTYYLRYNDHPGESLSIWLVVKAGSMNEPGPGLGIAHFLEHMLFKGADLYPGETLEMTLRDLGVELGPDLNAYVGHTQTVYDLTLVPHVADNVIIAFHALTQMAHAATLDPAKVESERGVVLDELRSARKTSYGYVSSEFDRIYTEGTPYEGRDPIGGANSIQSITAAQLRDFYEAWYVPSNMAVVAVGDWPVDKLETYVREQFGRIPAGEPPPLETPEVIPDPQPSYHTVVDEGQAYSYISLDIPIPVVDDETYGGERQLVMENLIERMILNRLEEAYYRGELSQVDPPEFHSFYHNRALRYYGTNWQGEDLDAASTDYWAVLLTAQEYGFAEADLENAVKQFSADLRHEFERSATINDKQFARRYANHFLFGEDISAAADRFERITGLLEEMTPEELTGHYRRLLERAGPIWIAVGPDAESIPTAAELEADISAAAPRSEPPPVVPGIEELMTEIPEAVEPVAVRELPGELEGAEWEFANGARVMYMYSDIDEGVVDIQAFALGGWSLLDPGARALAPRVAEAVLGSGLGEVTKPQINRLLKEHNVVVDTFIGETVEGFSGRAASRDAAGVEILFQMLHLLGTAPGVDEAAFRQALNEAEARTSLAEVNTGWQAWTAYNEARYGGERYRPVATRELLESLTADGLLDMYKERLGKVDDLVVAVVGDIEQDAVERMAGLYVGTLPAGEADSFANHRRPAPDGVVRREIAVDEGESAVLDLYYETERPVTPSDLVAAALLEKLLDNRLFQRLREELGASYTTSAGVDALRTPRPAILSQITITSNPDRLEEVYAEVLSILADLAELGPSAEDLGQARAVLENDYSFVSNPELLAVLISRLYTDDDELLTTERRLAELAALDAAAVQTLAGALYGRGDRIEIIRTPAAADG